MFQFRNLRDSYIVSVQHILPNDEVVSYSGKIDVEAKRIEKEVYRFTLLRRSDVLVDESPPEYGSDIMMKEIGDSLYPLRFIVSNTGNISDLINFEEIRVRWTEKREELLRKYHTFEFEQYLKASIQNMATKQRFMEILQRDVFIQFYFFSLEKGAAELHLCHFPKNGYKTSYFAVPNQKTDKDHYLLHPVFLKENILKTDGKLLYKKTKEGDVVNMKLKVNMLMEDQTYYRRNISICKDENTERLVNLWF